jgi:membrane protease YdiL (CAAX protease family)
MGMKSRVIQDGPRDWPLSATSTGVHPRPAGGVREFVRNHRMVLYFVLAYALAWGAVPWNIFFAPGALIAALLVAAVADGWPGLRDIGARLIRWRVGWRWYALAVAVPLAVYAAALGVNLAAGGEIDTGQFRLWYGVALAIGMNIVNPAGGPFSEEPSFRGLAVPRLQRRHTPLVAAAILAVAVTGWHAPLFVLSSFKLEPFEAITTLAVTFWYVWLFNRASGKA